LHPHKLHHTPRRLPRGLRLASRWRMRLRRVLPATGCSDLTYSEHVVAACALPGHVPSDSLRLLAQDRVCAACTCTQAYALEARPIASAAVLRYVLWMAPTQVRTSWCLISGPKPGCQHEVIGLGASSHIGKRFNSLLPTTRQNILEHTLSIHQQHFTPVTCACSQWHHY
jgi:hypothetical protein